LWKTENEYSFEKNIFPVFFKVGNEKVKTIQ